MRSKTGLNLLYIFPDQLGAKWLGCSGNSIIKTPNIDRFCRESSNFTSAYSNSPVCTPYRGLLFTGKYPSETGVRENGDEIPDQQKYLADYFNEADYRTSYVGKWHLSGHPHCNRWVQEDKRGGFQNFIGWESHHVDHMKGMVWERPDRPILFDGHETDGLTDVAINQLDYLSNESEDSPFCMFLSYQAPHPPCTPLSPYQEHYEGIDLCPEPNTDQEALFKNSFWDADYKTPEFRRRYYSEISHIDAAFGRILSYLDDSGLSENTIVIFTSDHGEMNGCHSLFGKGIFYEESIKVPLMIRHPDYSGKAINMPVSTIDLLPSLLDLCEIETTNSFQGKSIKGLLDGGASTPMSSPVFFEYANWIGILDDGFKLSMNRDSNELLAFHHLKEDPFEEHSLLKSTDMESAREKLAGKLINWKNSKNPQFQN